MDKMQEPRELTAKERQYIEYYQKNENARDIFAAIVTFISSIVLIFPAILLIAEPKSIPIFALIVIIILTVPLSALLFIATFRLIFSSRNYLKKSSEVFSMVGKIRYEQSQRTPDMFFLDSHFIKPTFGIRWENSLKDRAKRDVKIEYFKDESRDGIILLSLDDLSVDSEMSYRVVEGKLMFKKFNLSLFILIIFLLIYGFYSVYFHGKHGEILEIAYYKTDLYRKFIYLIIFHSINLLLSVKAAINYRKNKIVDEIEIYIKTVQRRSWAIS